MALPPFVVAAGFIIAVLAALTLMAYIAWRGNKTSDFFSDAVQLTYNVSLDEAEIEAYFQMKDRLQAKYAPESLHEAEAVGEGDSQEPNGERWAEKVPQEERQNLQKALMRRLVSCIGRLDQVQQDKPGHWKLWQSKLISERYWSSICDVENLVKQEIESCQAEAEELDKGWKEHIFPQAVQMYRMQRQHEEEKKAVKKAAKSEKKDAQKEVKRKEVEKRMEIEEKVRQEKAAQKAMEALLREEASSKKKGKEKTAPAAAKTKSKKK